MAYVPLVNLVPQFFDNLGDPLVGGTLNAYVAGTSTPTNMYSDDTGTVAGTSVTLDSRGEPTTIKLLWVDDGVTYKFVLKDSSGTTIWTEDNISFAAVTDGSITSAKIANNAVTASKIASGSVTNAKLGDGSVTSEKMANSGYELGSRNRFLNGSFAINQRGSSTYNITAAAALQYTLDRWYAYSTGGNVTLARTAGTAPTVYYARITGGASVTKVGFAQRIEKLNSENLAGSNATLSVYLANSLLTTVTWTAWRANSNDTFGTLASPTRTQIGTGTFSVTSTLTRYSTTIAIPAAATTGIEVEFSVGAQTSGTWDISNAQLEYGSNATVFEYRTYSDELNSCQRYYEEESSSTSFVCSTDLTITAPSRGYKVSKRVQPTLTVTVGGGSGATFATSTEGFRQNAANTTKEFVNWSASAEL
jgi:hypothetical protein